MHGRLVFVLSLETLNRHRYSRSESECKKTSFNGGLGNSVAAPGEKEPCSSWRDPKINSVTSLKMIQASAAV